MGSSNPLIVDGDQMMDYTYMGASKLMQDVCLFWIVNDKIE
jgi:hypothetical protein